MIIFSSILSNYYAQTQLDSIVSNGRVLYILEEDLMLNDYSISDSFDYDNARERIGIPDSTIFGGPEIIEEFGSDDYWMFYGKSTISAGHGYILMIEVFDQSLSISTVQIGDTREIVKMKLNMNFPIRDRIRFLTKGDDVFTFDFDPNGKLEKMFYWRPL